MTYNFDPDRWYENQRRAVDGRRARGEIGTADYQEELDRLEARYDQMARRLDASFDLPRPEAPAASGGPGRQEGDSAAAGSTDTPRSRTPPLPE